MSFATFDETMEAYQHFLATEGFPTSLLWLVRSRARCNRTSLYVFRQDELTDTTTHRQRFVLALRQKKNIAFCLHAIHEDRSLIGLETPGLDDALRGPPESGSHHFQILQKRLRMSAVKSPLTWSVVKTFVRNTHPMWPGLGWPP